MKAKLTATTIKRIEPIGKPFEVVDTEIKGFLLRVQPTGRRTFYFSYRTLVGKRKRIKIGVLGSSKTVAQAREDATVYAGKVSQGVDIQGEKVEGRQLARDMAKNSLSIFMEEQYKPWAVANLKSGEQTISSVKRTFPDLLTKPMVDIQLKAIERWRTERLEAGLKPTTINRVVHALRAVLTKAMEWEFIETHPLAGLKNLRVDEGKKARYLSDDEESRLYTALSERDNVIKAARARGNDFRKQRGYELYPDLSEAAYGDRMTPLITLSLKTGIRRGEAFDLRWSDIDFANEVITVRGETAKSSKTRHIPLSPIALNALTTWKLQSPEAPGRVFPAHDGGRLDNLNKSWRTLLKSAQIEHFRWHDMRHDFASKLVMRGVPLNTIRELCGHANLNTTLRYAHLAPDHKSEAVSLLG